MRILFAIPLILLILPSTSWSEALTTVDLVERNNLFYEKFTDIPFSREIRNPQFGSVLTVGNFIDGKKDRFVYRVLG